MNTSCDWGQLNADLLAHVIKHLPLADVRAARSVCSHWEVVCREATCAVRPNKCITEGNLVQLPELFPAAEIVELIDCNSNKFCCYDLDGLSRLQHLHTLVLSGSTRVGKRCYHHLAQLTGLTRLELAESASATLSTAPLASMAVLPRLQALRLHWCAHVNDQWSPADVAGITGLRSLQLHSDCECFWEYSWELQPLLRQLLLLTSLKVLYSRVTPGPWSWPTGLRVVSLEGTSGQDAATLTDCLESLARDAEGLVELNLNYCRWLARGGLRALLHMTALRKLGLQSCYKVADDDICALAVALPSLRSLDIAWCSAVGDAGVAALGSLTCLTYLDLSLLDQVTGRGVQRLSGLTRLRELGLIGCHEVKEEGMQAVAGMRKLETLELGGCHQLGNGALRCLRHLTRLTSLNISEWEWVTPTGLRHLQRLSRLASLDVTGCRQLAEKGLRELQDFRRFAPGLQELIDDKPEVEAAAAREPAIEHQYAAVEEEAAEEGPPRPTLRWSKGGTYRGLPKKVKRLGRCRHGHLVHCWRCLHG